MSRARKRRRGASAGWIVLLALLACLALLLMLEKSRSLRPAPAASAPAETAEPSPSPSETPQPTPSPSPSPMPTPEPTPDSRYHTGDAELDELLYAIVDEQTDETMSDEEKLHALFRYVSGSFGYLRRNYYEPGETGWENKEALTMLTEGKGNCYNYSSLFGLLARCIGYDAEICSGTIYGQAEDGQTRPPDNPHGWVEINIDGSDYIFDADMEAVGSRWNEDDSFYMRGDDIRGQYGYKQYDADGNRMERPAAEDVTEKP